MAPCPPRPRIAAARLLAASLLSVCLLAPPAFADTAPVGDRIFDAAVLRPLAAIGTVVGFGFFVCSLPLAAPLQKTREAWDVFVVPPTDYTFQRGLGEF